MTRLITPVTDRNLAPHTFNSETLADLERAAHDAITVSAALANAARAADILPDDAPLNMRIRAIVEIETYLAALDAARRRAAVLARTARIELGR